jgi:hypothetical protein
VSELELDGLRFRALLDYSFHVPAGTRVFTSPPAVTQEEHDRIVRESVDKLIERMNVPSGA